MTKNFADGLVPPKIGELLYNFRLRAALVSDTHETFGCLALFNQVQTDAVVVANPDETNRLVLLDHKNDLFFLGISQHAHVTSKGILPASKSKGSNHVVLNDPVVLIVRRIELAEEIKNHLNS